MKRLVFEKSYLGDERKHSTSKLKGKKKTGASLVVPGLRIRLLMQGTPVQSLVWEEPHASKEGLGASKPVHHSC